MHVPKKYIIIGAIFALLVAGAIDWMSFQKNGGHKGGFIVGNSEEVGRNIAKAWIENSAPTYAFDGTNLAFIEEKNGDCEGCFLYTFSFESRYGGYGNREGLTVTQAITPHSIAVSIKGGKVIQAIIDGKYNEMTGALAE